MQLLGLSCWGLNMLQIELLCKRCGLGCRDAVADTVASSNIGNIKQMVSPGNLQLSLSQASFQVAYIIAYAKHMCCLTCVKLGCRKVTAETVAGDQEQYTEGFLGKPNADYCKWIQDKQRWGGAIELAILSRSVRLSPCKSMNKYPGYAEVRWRYLVNTPVLS